MLKWIYGGQVTFVGARTKRRYTKTFTVIPPALVSVVRGTTATGKTMRVGLTISQVGTVTLKLSVRQRKGSKASVYGQKIVKIKKVGKAVVVIPPGSTRPKSYRTKLLKWVYTGTLGFATTKNKANPSVRKFASKFTVTHPVNRLGLVPGTVVSLAAAVQVLAFSR